MFLQKFLKERDNEKLTEKRERKEIDMEALQKKIDAFYESKKESFKIYEEMLSSMLGKSLYGEYCRTIANVAMYIKNQIIQSQKNEQSCQHSKVNLNRF